MAEEKIGVVSRFFAKINVAAVDITSGELKVGDKIRIKGATTDLEHVVDSMQIEHATVEVAKAGDSVGMKVAERVREKDEVFKLTDD